MKLHIYGALQSYKKRAPVRMHMPGHKGSRAFALFGSAAAYDITELPFSDCLESPSGIIARAQTDIADILGARRSHILTDGSTCGIYAMLWAVRGRGAKLIASRDSHKSVFSACAVLGIEPLLLRGGEKEGILLPPSAADIETALQKERDVCAVLVTSPDYYGNVADLAGIAAACRRHGKPLLVDGAHGAYLRFDPDEADAYAGKYADLWVDGSHKTMPTLTQGALLNVGAAADDALAAGAAAGLQLFRTTSPSYLVMASVEYGVKYLEENGAALIDALMEKLDEYDAAIQCRHLSDALGHYGEQDVDRSQYYAIQTPECFRFEVFYRHFREEFPATCLLNHLPLSASRFLYFDFINNLKMTYPEDIDFLTYVLEKRRREEA